MRNIDRSFHAQKRFALVLAFLFLALVLGFWGSVVYVGYTALSQPEKIGHFFGSIKKGFNEAGR